MIRRRSVKTIMLPLLLLAAAVCVREASAQIREGLPHQYYNDEMSIRDLYYESDKIGSAVWLRRGPNNIRAKYFATGQVVQRYLALAQSEKVILVCEGAFSDTPASPHGLTIDNGRIVNRFLSPEMHGLVIVYATGGIAVSDIQRDMLNLEGGRQKLDITKSDDKTFFLGWSQQNNATVFQTQLLASSAGLRLEVPKANGTGQSRERRFLAILQDNSTSEVLHAVIDVPKSFYLGELAKLVYDYLSTKGKVFGLLNLDVGSYNILQVNGPNGPLPSPSGTRPVGKATNLLVYYYAK
jgi:hypothetical protein